MEETKDLNKPVPPTEPVVNPEDESTQPPATTGDGEGNEGDDEEGGDHPTKKPDDPTP